MAHVRESDATLLEAFEGRSRRCRTIAITGAARGIGYDTAKRQSYERRAQSAQGVVEGAEQKG